MKITPLAVKNLTFPDLTWDEIKAKGYANEHYGIVYCFYSLSYDYVVKTRKYFGDVKSLLDFGAGYGITTIKLGQLYNIVPTYFDINPEYVAKAKELSKQFGTPIEITNKLPLKHFDLLCVWEVLEHCEKPVELFRALLKNCTPTYISYHSSFTLKALGHRDDFDVDGRVVPKAKMYREIENCLNGYERLEVKLWNNKPRLYQKKN